MNGALVRDLSPRERNDKIAAGTLTPREGVSVRLWQLGGLWRIWSMGPTRGTRWCAPADSEARELYDVTRTRPQDVRPILRDAMSGCVVIACADMRPTIARRGEA